jgi:hypothetical protein
LPYVDAGLPTAGWHFLAECSPTVEADSEKQLRFFNGLDHTSSAHRGWLVRRPRVLNSANKVYQLVGHFDLLRPQNGPLNAIDSAAIASTSSSGQSSHQINGLLNTLTNEVP